MTESASFKAIGLTRSFFELVNGEIGLLKFNIDELTEIDKKTPSDPEKWTVICSFVESLGSSTRSKYRVIVDVDSNTLEVKKISPGGEAEKVEGKWKMSPVTEPKVKQNDTGSQKT